MFIACGAAITQKASLITADKLSVLVADWKRETKLNYEWRRDGTITLYILYVDSYNSIYYV